MKPLILVLLMATTVHAQSISLADAARKERERRAATPAKNVHVFTTEEAKNAGSGAPAAEATPTAGAASTAPAPAAKTTPAPAPAVTPKPAAPPAAKTADDARKKYTEDLAKLKARVVALQDQETAVQLQINNLKNSFLSPVTDQAAQADARVKLEQAQTQLATTQKDLADAKKAAADLDAQGPPKP